MKSNLQKRTLHVFGLLVIAAAIVTGTGTAVTAAETNNRPVISELQKRYDQAIAEIGQGGEWKDPEKALPEVQFDQVPLQEVGQFLLTRFNNEFDVLFPFGEQVGWDWTGTLITLRLKSVTAREIFNAMNLVFASAGTPLHWELMSNGHRPTALLRILAEPKPTVDPNTGLPLSSPPAPVEKPMVFFVGDLVGDERPGRMTMDELVRTIDEVCKLGIGGGHLSSHRQAQLLVVRGSAADIEFVQNTLVALRDKLRLDSDRIHEQNHKALPVDVPKQRAQPEADRKEAPSKSDATTPR